jgi:hypothetical protein
MSQELAGDGDIEITRAQNRNYALGVGFHRVARQSNSISLMLRYQAQAERQYRRAVEEFERLKALRDDLPDEGLPNEATTEVQPEQNEPACAPPGTKPSAGPPGDGGAGSQRGPESRAHSPWNEPDRRPADCGIAPADHEGGEIVGGAPIRPRERRLPRRRLPLCTALFRRPLGPALRRAACTRRRPNPDRYPVRGASDRDSPWRA